MKELARRLKEAGIRGVVANSVNPGGVKTAIFRHARKAFKYMIMVSQFFFKTPSEGAQPIVYLCVSEEVENESGFYWSDCKKDTPSKLAQDVDLGRELWEMSSKIVGLTENENHLKIN